ncbi:phage major capsid protein [Thalassospira marina]|uniref:Phage major capsid protein n=1 Tax=Thalassospira marina TaxID=2048283 RepID=A0A2N3KY48_9PROT|nr:phage major capsid protein [Thalassospira marina]PKR55407.1 phage major capsid protein [Thalassospira marina]
MASANPSFDDIVTTTLRGYSGKFADNVTNHNALLRYINEKGNKKYATGRSIVQELDYAENSTVKWYSGSEVLDVSGSETFTAAEFTYKQLNGNVVINGLEEIQNSGTEAVHNLLRSRVKNLDRSLKNTMATAIYGDGTGSNGKEIGGLQLLVADVNTNTVGGIDANAYAFWRNQVYDFSANSVTPSSGTIQTAMNDMFVETTRGADKTDFIVADKTYYIYYWESLQAQQRFTVDTKAAAGFQNIAYAGNISVFFDSECPAEHMYFLNTDYLHLRPSKGREFTPSKERMSVNQDAMVKPVFWAGNMTCSNRSLQGVIHA